MADHVVPHAEIIARTDKLQEILLAGSYDGALIAQKTDLFYFGGTAQQGWLYVPAQGRPVLMVFKEFDRARQESPLADVVSVSGLKQLPEAIAAAGLPSPGRMGLELDVLPVNTYFQYQKLFPQAILGDISHGIRLIRAVKSAYEIDKIRAAAALADLVAAQVPELLVAGKTEIALAGEVEGYARSLGHQGIVRMRMWNSELFYGHLLSGEAAAVPSYLASPTGGEGVSSAVAQGSGRKKIARNEPVLVDYVFALDGYLADHARIFSLGELAPELMAAHQAMLAIQGEVMAQALPGMVTGELYELMVARAEEAGYGESFMGVGGRRIRFTGHGVGLELDEYPFIAKGQKLELAAGMVIALEPKTIFPGKGVVGIENTHLVTESGLKPLTKFPDAIQILP
ncbi:MAG: Xaa-Pro peptidase family protein [Desulforhopalus sp.]|jgi:Xaa-Pro aminopeptidase|nr:Xaa-Pro peptidase family protein [Desulforhopalus sp.]